MNVLPVVKKKTIRTARLERFTAMKPWLFLGARLFVSDTPLCFI